MAEIRGMKNGRKYPDGNQEDCSKPCDWYDGDICRLHGYLDPPCLHASAAEPKRATRTYRKASARESRSCDWTAAEIAALRHGESAAEIAKAIGRSEKAVVSKAKKMGIHLRYNSREVKTAGPRVSRPWTDEELAMLKDGAFAPDIAEALGRTVSSVKNMAHKKGVHLLYKRRSKAVRVYTVYSILKPLCVGTREECAAALGVTPEEIDRYAVSTKGKGFMDRIATVCELEVVE